MRSFQLPTPPLCLTSLAGTRPNGPWFDQSDSAEVTCRQAIRKVLLKNQDDTCGWCEAKISFGSSHAEHILPKSNPAYASLTFAISNLIGCCGKSGSQTCGHHKGESILPAWVHPYNTPRLEERFIYGDDGEMAPDESLATATRAEALIAIDTILNLNGTVLKGKREYLINEIVKY